MVQSSLPLITFLPNTNTSTGYTQSGPLFRTKTRAMEKLLVKTLTPFSLHPTLIYPTAPNRLRPSDIPGYTPSPNANPDDAPDMWAWFRRDEASGTYRYFDEGMTTLAEAIREAGGIDAVCGFSQGGAMTGLVAAALEPGRKIPEGKGGDWARALREANGGKGVKFAVSYSGFRAVPEDFAWCFDPKIAVPSLHYIGSLDTVVEESRSQELIERCEDPKVIVHPGGHHVPVSKEWVMPFAAFIRDNAQDEPRAGL